MTLRYLDSIWTVRGSLALTPGQSSADAFLRLDPLFHQSGTSHERTDDILTFRKKDQAAQDKMSIFDSGTLQIEQGVEGLLLRYRLISRALLFCFLAPLLFLAIAQMTIMIGKYQKPPTAAEQKAAETPVVPMNPIDKALGAPEPKKPAKKIAGESEVGKSGVGNKPAAADGEKDDDEKDKKPSPIPAYVFAGIFAALYGVGRILEDRLVKRLFRRTLLGS